MLLKDGEPYKLTEVDIDAIKKKHGNKVVFKLNTRFSSTQMVYPSGAFNSKDAMASKRYAPQSYPNTMRVQVKGGGEEEWTYFQTSSFDKQQNRILKPASTVIGEQRKTGTLELFTNKDLDLIFFLLKYKVLADGENHKKGSVSHFHIVDKIQTAKERVRKLKDYNDLMDKIIGADRMSEDAMRSMLLALGKSEAIGWTLDEMQDHLGSRARDPKEQIRIAQHLGGPMVKIKELIVRARLEKTIIIDKEEKTWYTSNDGVTKGELIYKVHLQGDALGALATYIAENPHKLIREYLENSIAKIGIDEEEAKDKAREASIAGPEKEPVVSEE